MAQENAEYQSLARTGEQKEEVMPAEEKKDLDILKGVCAKVSEMFPEYLVIVRGADGNLCWKRSDKTWATGAAQRFLWASDESDRVDERVQIEERENNGG